MFTILWQRIVEVFDTLPQNGDYKKSNYYINLNLHRREIIMANKKKFLMILVIFCIAVVGILLLMQSLNSKKDLVAAPSSSPAIKPTASPTKPTPEPTPDLSNKAVSMLTGEYIDKELAAKRPYAVVINNMHIAKPQSGISEASLFYEVLSEADITRIIAIFQGAQAEKIGPIRSTRHYFLDFALDNDAIFFHYGQSPQAEKALKDLKINNLNGIYDSKTYWRDPKRSSVPKMLEHSAYTDAEKMVEGVERNDYRQEIRDSYKPMFEFYDTLTAPKNGIEAQKVTVPFSKAYTSSFEFDKKTGLYNKFDGDKPHLDEETQLTVTNIIVQNVKMHVIAGDDAGRRDVQLISSGEGYLITNGKYIPITWKKTSHESPTQWFDSDGNKLTLNKGKTWICVYDGNITFEPNDDSE